MNVRLDNYDQSHAFDYQDDPAYSNMAVLLVARIIQLIHTPATSSHHPAWESLEIEVDAWYDSKPDTFTPLFFEDADPGHGSPFPTISLLSAGQGMSHVQRDRSNMTELIFPKSGWISVLLHSKDITATTQTFVSHIVRF